MKKLTKILLLSLVALCLLTGCYQQDVTLNIKHSGAEFNSEMYATDEAYNFYWNNNNAETPITHTDIIGSNLTGLQELTANDANLKVEEIEKEIDGVKYYGVKASGKFDSASEMISSDFFSRLNTISIFPKEDKLNEFIEQNHVGISYDEKINTFGTTYKINGFLSLTQGNSEAAKYSEEEMAKLEKAISKLKIKFPVFSLSFSKGNKFFLAPSFEYVASNNATEQPINISVYVPNFVILAAILIIILLIIIILMLLKKIKLLTPALENDDEQEEEMLSEDDENFFEGNEENTEFVEEVAEDEGDIENQDDENSEDE